MAEDVKQRPPHWSKHPQGSTKKIKKFREHNLEKRASNKKQRETPGKKKYKGTVRLERGPISKPDREKRLRKKVEEKGTFNLGGGKFATELSPEVRKLRTKRRKANLKAKIDKRNSKMIYRDDTPSSNLYRAGTPVYLKKK